MYSGHQSDEEEFEWYEYVHATGTPHRTLGVENTKLVHTGTRDPEDANHQQIPQSTIYSSLFLSMTAGDALAERVVSSIESLALGARCHKCPPLGVFVALFQFRNG